MSDIDKPILRLSPGAIVVNDAFYWETDGLRLYPTDYDAPILLEVEFYFINPKTGGKDDEKMRGIFEIKPVNGVVPAVHLMLPEGI